MDILITILIAACILLVAQQVLIINYRRRHIKLCETMTNTNRAFKILRGNFLDSEQERKWLNNQIAILTSEDSQDLEEIRVERSFENGISN
jgi:hypothetical protein